MMTVPMTIVSMTMMTVLMTRMTQMKILFRPWVMEGSPDEEPAPKDPAAHIMSAGHFCLYVFYLCPTAYIPATGLSPCLSHCMLF